MKSEMQRERNERVCRNIIRTLSQRGFEIDRNRSLALEHILMESNPKEYEEDTYFAEGRIPLPTHYYECFVMVTSHGRKIGRRLQRDIGVCFLRRYQSLFKTIDANREFPEISDVEEIYQPDWETKREIDVIRISYFQDGEPKEKKINLKRKSYRKRFLDKDEFLNSSGVAYRALDDSGRANFGGGLISFGSQKAGQKVVFIYNRGRYISFDDSGNFLQPISQKTSHQKL